MPQTLVETKLRPPRTRPNLVARPRLRGLLDRGGGRKLTLVSAPAGFGKTTLLAEWLGERSQEGSVAWLSLDASDNDPARFFSYLVGALRNVEEGLGEGVLAALRSPGFPPPEALAEALINELAATGREVTIVLDDYHLIDPGPVHALVSHLLGRLPENARLVISGRADPPLPIPRLRAGGEVAEVRAADLRFAPEEAAAFLNGAMGLGLSAGEVATLEGITEGWAAALQLAALSMRGREDVSGFVGAFSGSNRHVLDYLAEEVLGRQPEEVGRFLLETAVLGRMTAPLCDAVTGRSDGQVMLERLEKGNLFVVALDEERRWYRYHHLFRDFLRSRLSVENAGLAGELHLRASRWYENEDLLVEAIEHALLGSGADPDHEHAARLIEAGFEGAVERGEGTTVLRWLEALPTEAKRLRPRLFAEHALALSLTGRPDDAEPLLQEAERAADEVIDGEDGPFLLGLASAVRSWRARLRGEAPEAVEFARRSLSLLPEREASVRNFAAVCLGDALRTVGDLAAAGEAFAEAAEIARVAGHAYGRLAGMAMLARVRAEQGRLREADQEFRRALRLLTEGGFGTMPAAGVVNVGMADLRYERDDLDAAERELERGVELAERAGEVSALVWAYVVLSRTRRARGDEGAMEIARQAERVARESGADLQIAIALSWMTRLYLARGDLAEASALVKERAALADAAADAARAVDRLTSARLLLAQGWHREALPLLEDLGKTAQASGRKGGLIEILVLQALALWAGGKKERAVETLTQALALAEPEGYVRTFVEEGAPMGDLLSATLEARQAGRLDAAERISVSYLARLLASVAREATTPAADERLPEPLSEREFEVLALISAGRSNKEITRELSLSMSTIKTHINRLYRKLGTRSRTQAVARAREMNLL